LFLVRYSSAIRKKESSGRKNSTIFPGLERQRGQKIVIVRKGNRFGPAAGVPSFKGATSGLPHSLAIFDSQNARRERDDIGTGENR
jgi:hypothetical protein